MSTPGPTAGTSPSPESPAHAPVTTPMVPTKPTKPTKPKEPPITAGQRANAILAGIAGHILFGIGWFGIAFVILGTAVSPLVNDLLANILGDVDAQRFTEIISRASSLLWLLGLVFFVGSAAFVVFGILSSLAILKRGGVDKPGVVNWSAFVIAAILDLPAFLLALWVATMVTDNSPDLLWFPPVLALVLIVVIGIVVWWLMAHANRGKPAPKPPKAGKAANGA